jgi:hypothetical protein
MKAGTEARPTRVRPADACRAKQELGREKGVPKQELGNDGEIDFFVVLREPGDRRI